MCRGPRDLEHPHNDIPAHHHDPPWEAAADLVKPPAPYGLRDGRGDDVPAGSGVAGASFFPAARFSLGRQAGAQVFWLGRQARTADYQGVVQQGSLTFSAVPFFSC